MRLRFGQRPWAFSPRRRGKAVAHHTLSITEYETLPRPLRVSDLHRLRAALDMPYRLMAEWAVTTGMRWMELCAQGEADPAQRGLHLDDDPLVGVALTVAKGKAAHGLSAAPSTRSNQLVHRRGSCGTDRASATVTP